MLGDFGVGFIVGFVCYWIGFFTCAMLQAGKDGDYENKLVMVSPDSDDALCILLRYVTERIDEQKKFTGSKTKWSWRTTFGSSDGRKWEMSICERNES